MRIVVTGSRHGVAESLIESAFRYLPQDTEIIHGDAPGVDKMAAGCAKDRRFTVTAVPADWDTLGKAAGPIRNRKMLDMKPDLVLAFHDDLEESKGTRDCVIEAVRRRIPVVYVYEKPA